MKKMLATAALILAIAGCTVVPGPVVYYEDYRPVTPAVRYYTYPYYYAPPLTGPFYFYWDHERHHYYRRPPSHLLHRR